MLGFHFHFPQVYPHTHDLRILGKDKSKWQPSPLHLSLSFIREMMGKQRQPYYDQFSYRAISHLTAAFRRMALEGARQRRPGCLSRGIWWGSTFSPLTRDVGGTCRQLGFSSIFLFVSHCPLARRPQINLTRILFQQLKTNFRCRDPKGKFFSTNQTSNVVGQVEQAAKKLNQSFSSSRK